MDILLVHGLGRTPVSLFLLAAALRRAGHRTHFFGYSPTFETLPRIVRRLTARLETLAGQPVGLIGHSLGGLLLRIAIPNVPRLRVHRLVMLGPPNRPPRLGRRAWKVIAFRRLTRDCGALLANPEKMAAIPSPTVAYSLIAGTAGPRGRWSPFGDDPNDGVVAVNEVPLRDGDEPLLFPVWHSFMMNHQRVQEAVVKCFFVSPTRQRGSP